MIEVKVEGMHCGGCAASLQRALSALPGAGKVSVEFARGTAQIEGEVSREAIIDAIEEQGFTAV